MKIIAVANMKGGVGKTTTSIVLCDTLSAVGGKRVLALDLDSQANFSWALLSPSRFAIVSRHRSLTGWLKQVNDDQPPSLTPILEDVSLQLDRNWNPLGAPGSPPAKTHLAVSEPGMRFEEMEHEGPAHADPATSLSRRLKEAIDKLEGNFDYCVMDCSPALSALTRAGLRLADAIIIPTPLNHLCLQSSATFQSLGLKRMLGLDTPIFILPTRVGMSSGKGEASQVRDLLRDGEAKGKWKRLDPEFPESVEYMRALNPPAMSPHPTLKARYGSRRGDLKAFLQSLKSKGIVQ